MHLGRTQTLCKLPLILGLFLELSNMSSLHVVEEICLVGASPSFVPVTHRARLMLSQSCLEEDVRLRASEVAY